MPPSVSQYYRAREPSPIRRAQILLAARPDRENITVINLSIGNVSLPTHPAIQARMQQLTGPTSPFAEGSVRYVPTVGLEETRQAFLNIIASAGCATDELQVIVTDGGSMAMELMLLGVCGPGTERPLLLFDPSYSNYTDMAKRIAARTISARRLLGTDSRYSMPDLMAVERLIQTERPSGLVIIPADNPTGQYLDQATINQMARLCIQHNLWLVSDEAYRQLNYGTEPPSSIWAVQESDAPGIHGSRISIESASKTWNACGLRVGALVTDNPEFFTRALAEYTANLSGNAIGQWLFGALAHIPHSALTLWYEQQRAYYRELMRNTVEALRNELPGLLVSNPEASLYSVLDMRDLAPDFNANDFVRFCAEQGRVNLDGKDYTLLLAPLAGFQGGAPDPAARTQMRLAYVEGPESMKKVPRLFRALLKQYGISCPNR